MPSNFYQYQSYTFEGHTSNLDIAAFGQVAVKLGGGVEASLGGRWTETRSNNFGPYWYFGTEYSLNAPPQKSYNFSYKAALDWAIDDGNFLYGFVATGYTGGGLNVILSGGAPKSFGPVTDTNYEVGWKATDWFDGHVHSEIDAYYTTYNHFQVALENPDIPNTTDEFNLPEATTNYGVEAELQAAFGQFSSTASIGLLRSQLGDYYLGDPRYNNVTFGTCDISPSGSHTNPACMSVKGHQMTYAPSATFNITAQLGPRDLVGGQLAWQTGSYIISLYGENLTNDQYVSANDSGGLYAGPPRQYGIRLSKYF
jgi:iron complex outermembrane receptor protein